ncbi:hypothetical protein [Sphingobium baderi]|uniref:hypothetical protein n=1 Tax=Sphingobium baderi TaxID=1332080 RepID=UPI002B4139A6|nr:hypothetical protein [Sphingobium baderi]WRD78999.1 hypothetical protein QQ987_21450 [Sphingobium baderi]
MGTTASYPVNRLMQELFTNPGNVELFRADREALYERYGLSSAQRAALDEGGFGALTAVGLHPVLQMGSVAKIVKLEHAWRRLDGRNDDGFQVAPFPG